MVGDADVMICVAVSSGQPVIRPESMPSVRRSLPTIRRNRYCLPRAIVHLAKNSRFRLPSELAHAIMARTVALTLIRAI
jgi:hypothetical protein